MPTVPSITHSTRRTSPMTSSASGLTRGPILASGCVAAWATGSLGDYHVAGLACLGAVIGFQIGLRVGPYAAVKWLKTGMCVLLVLVAVQYLFLR